MTVHLRDFLLKEQVSIIEGRLDPRNAAALNAFLRALVAQRDLPLVDRCQDRARQRARRWGLAYFDRQSWTWMITDAGREYVTSLLGEIPK